MNKAVVTKEQAKAIEYWLSTYVGSKEDFVRSHIETGEWVDGTSALNGIPLETLIVALYIGYEIEQSPEQKVLNLYRSTTGATFSYNDGIRKGIAQTLDILNIQIKGMNIS